MNEKQVRQIITIDANTENNDVHRPSRRTVKNTEKSKKKTKQKKKTSYLLTCPPKAQGGIVP